MDLSSEFAKARALHVAGRLAEAAAIYQEIVKHNPRLAPVHAELAAVLMEAGKIEQGLRVSEKALRLDPNQPGAWTNRGLGLYYLKRHDEALSCYDKALALMPDLVEAHANRALTLYHLGKVEPALDSIDRALAIAPDLAPAHLYRAMALVQAGRAAEALWHAERAIALGMGGHEPHLHRAQALHGLNRIAEAQDALDRAIALEPGCAEAHLLRGAIALERRAFEEAASAYASAIAASQAIAYAPGALLHAKMMLCDWSDYDERWRALLRKAGDGKRVSMVFPILAVPARPMQIFKLAKLNAAASAGSSRRVIGRPAGGARIKLGYFSSDYYAHATSYLLAGLIEAHDRDRFEVIGFSYGPPRQDAMRARLARGFDRFLDVSDQSDQAVAALARQTGVDIAVDLKGYTQGGRSGVFACGAAPAQVSYLGYPATMGADFIDYLIADPVLIPPAFRAAYSEKIVYLPGSYQVNDATRAISARAFTRAELGLPETGFVFCSFNNVFKITPDLFDIWMRLLAAVEGSVLWLYEGNKSATANLRSEAARRAIAPERLVFAPFMEVGDHLARHAHADLFLDSFYFNAHTTASDALWAGLPVLTKIGETFAGRVAASLLTAIGMPELIAPDEVRYEEIALDLARSPVKLAALKAKLAVHRRSQQLFDTARFARHIEQAYLAIYARALAGQAPADIVIPPMA